MTLRRNRVSALVGTASMLAVGFSPLLLTGTAHAADANSVVWASDKGFTYDGNMGINNQLDLTLSETEEKFVFTADDSVPIVAYDDCTHPDSADLTKVVCEIPKTAPVAEVRLGNGADRVTYTNTTGATNFTEINLGVGNDVYVTGRPEANDAVVYGGEANDDITLGTNGIAYGDHGYDTINLVGGTAKAYGGDHNDQINGGGGNDELYGDAGDDIIYGNDGDDSITGGTGNDELYGGRHNDTLYGNSGDDTIFGNSGDDYISGGAGLDTISGGAGNNTIVDI
ncbi:hypothetical protein Kisp01_25330 [Kineosporia sp. NBRC 101677]|uniref:calcium-binding protein n=1 Tax=Kineosporia sp. NBRC 101677 TaxID=3032197 RepID=UPI00249FEF32|nr:calcium-binding protein [Kineosporia sp. NBRC 101677]GLY15518.1 hypothetical protein Kisp01_25330 [Kineosporia sp. NBRC 101677]